MNKNYPEIELIRQTDNTGCGIACLAMLSFGKYNYDDVKSVLFPSSRANQKFYTEYPQLKKGLQHIEVSHAGKARRCSYDWHKVKNNIQSLAIVACGFQETNSTFHWVVFDGSSKKVYDPLRDKPLIPDNRAKTPFSYLMIYP